MSAAAAIAGLLTAAAAIAPLGALRPARARTGPTPASHRPGPDPVGCLGRAIASRTRLEPNGHASTLGWAAIASAPLLALAPPMAVGLVTGAWVVVRHRQARARAEDRRALDEALPDVVDLLHLCTSGGMGLALAHHAVAARTAGSLGEVLRRADAAATAGQPRAEALVAALTPCGERATTLAHLLADHLRYGAPLGPPLERLALELRLDRRRRAEESARRVPVRLLAPLVTCTLPAFALLSVVPLLAASLDGIPR